MQAMGMMNSNSQLRNNGTITSAQRMNQAQMRQQLSQQTPLTSSEHLQGSSKLAHVNRHISGLAQNGQSTLMQNSVSQEQWLKQTPSMSAPASPSLFVEQRQQQLAASSQLNQNFVGWTPQQLYQLAPKQVQQQLQQQQQQHPLQQQQPSHRQQQQQQQPHPGQQQPPLLQQQQQSLPHLQMPQQQATQMPLHELQKQQPSPWMRGPAIQKSISPTGLQPDATAPGTNTPVVNSSRGTEATNQILGKRKIQDLVAQVNPHAKLDLEAENILLEMAENFINSAITNGCNLAKHRKSSVLEPRDLLLHLGKNWKYTVPGLE